MVARESRLAPDVLERLVEVFADAGYRAVDEHTAHKLWWQADLEFNPHNRAAVAELTVVLDTVYADGQVTQWWFLNKNPGWRLRVHLASSEARVRMHEALDGLRAQGTVHEWHTGTYEPETAAFGGPTGIAIAHELFSADSRAVSHLASDAELSLGRKQISLMLCTELMHSSGLEPLEHGDVWDLVCTMRPLSYDAARGQVEAMFSPVQKLLNADTDPDGAMFGKGQALHTHAAWAEAFSEAGHRLGRARQAGVLRRGLRRIISQHIIFHWNRLAIPADVQGALARAARAVILDVPACNESFRVTVGDCG